MSTLPTAPEDPREWKIFPRNLTARAAYIVPGNSVATRPEDGVDNCYPGLEMDAKNIQKMFFPGLYFEVYRQDGARLVSMTPASLAQRWKDLGLTDEDLDHNLYLWAMHGRNNDLDGAVQVTTMDFTGKQGLYAWRQINSLLPGDVSIAVGPNPPMGQSAFKDALTAIKAGGNKLERDPNGKLLFAAMTAPRLEYLNEQGVLAPEVYDPGDLTRTLCTPWTYDFRDCQCFYWASNKPDVISSEDGQYEYLNFQRKNRNVEPQTEDIAYGYNARRQREIDYAEMMDGWEQLRPVLNGREFGETYVPPEGPTGPVMSLEQIKEEVTYLASVEHALAVQYLYAFYSVDVPWTEPDKDESIRTFRLWHSARTVFDVAIDEMRHFRWANEILSLLGADTTAKRASTLGRTFKVPFYMQSLSSPQLQWFIDVERPSRSTVAGLDGMYVGILHSLQQLGDDEIEPEVRRQAIEIVKLIVDEGEGHYVRFSTAQQNFAFYDDAARGALPSYILDGTWKKPTPNTNPDIPYDTIYGQPAEADDPEGKALQQESNNHYQALLMLLKIAFAIPEAKISGPALRRAISVMFRMNAVNLELAGKGVTPLFTLPDGWELDPPVRSRDDAMKLLDRAHGLLAQPKTAMALMSVRERPQPGLGADPAHDSSVEQIMEAFAEAIDKSRFRE
ncbi:MULTISPECIES: ferritin-like domain-containing protein [unclassified Mameliella]|uniref:ferritin-like domain-containing protein n=1 Tax=unclassified Mameliella TaxID=2630630 RepID=UPI00273FC328|nr:MULTISPECIES: ferritin-like domain-containing protein [unclassified Mameliella]